MSDSFGEELEAVGSTHDASMRLIDLLTETVGKLARNLEVVARTLDLCGEPSCTHASCSAELEALRGLLTIAGLEKRLREIGLD